MVIEIHKMTLIHFKLGVTMRHVFTILYILSVFILANCSTENSKLVGFTKKTDVFGIQIVATETTPDDKIIHAANVMAEYIDCRICILGLNIYTRCTGFPRTLGTNKKWVGIKYGWKGKNQRSAYLYAANRFPL